GVARNPAARPCSTRWPRLPEPQPPRTIFKRRWLPPQRPLAKVQRPRATWSPPPARPRRWAKDRLATAIRGRYRWLSFLRVSRPDQKFFASSTRPSSLKPRRL